MKNALDEYDWKKETIVEFLQRRIEELQAHPSYTGSGEKVLGCAETAGQERREQKICVPWKKIQTDGLNLLRERLCESNI